MQTTPLVFEGVYLCLPRDAMSRPLRTVETADSRFCCPQLVLIESSALPPTLQQTTAPQQTLKLAREIQESLLRSFDHTWYRSQCVALTQEMCLSLRCCPA